nr:hypothetical protein [Tanacetum cinerariifolium]
SVAFKIYNKRTRKIHESVNVNFDEILEMASKQFGLEPGLSNLNETKKSSNPSVSKVSETSKKDLEDLFQDFYDEYFDSSKIMKSLTTNVETSINEKVIHEVSESLQGESSSSSLNDDVQQSPEEVILPQSISNNMIPNGDEASTSHNVFNERLVDAYFDASTLFHDPFNVHTYYQPYPHEKKWTKDHPLHKIIGDPKSSVRTREEIATEVVPPTPTSPSPSSPVLEKCSVLVLRVEGLENANDAQQLEIIKLKARVKKLERLNKGRISVDMETDEGIELEDDQEKCAEVERRQADTQAEIYNIDLDHSSKVLIMQEDTEVQEAVEVVTTAKLITEVVTAAATQVAAASTPILAAKPKVLKIAAAPAVSTRRRKGVVIRDPEEELHPMKKKDKIEMDAEYAKKLQEELEKEHEEAYKQIDWNAAFDHVQAKETQYIKRYHGLKKKPQSESKARKNMISYLKNTKGFKMEFFKGKTYNQILPIFQARFDANLKFLFKTREEMEKEDEEIIKSINETPAQKVAKRRKLSEEAQEADNLRGRLEIVQDEDDVFVEAISLAQKVPVVDYQNFDREDLETLWRIVKDRFSTKKPTNFSDEYLLLTLKTMFGELDEKDPIWRNQKSVHGLALAKVKVVQDAVAGAAHTKDPEEESSEKTPTKTKSKDKGKGVMYDS